jgi:hypothetical protein
VLRFYKKVICHPKRILKLQLIIKLNGENSTTSYLLCTTFATSPEAIFAHENNRAVVPEGVIGEIETTNIKMKFDSLVIRGAQIFNGCN